MANVLFVNELGEGSHHVDILCYAAEVAYKMGHNCHFSIPVLERHAARLQGRNFSVSQTPLMVLETSLRGSKRSPAAFSDILGDRGFCSKDELVAIKKVWEDEFTLRKIDLIFCNYAPTVIQVARGNIPVVNIGTFWDIPSPVIPETLRFRNQRRRINDKEILRTLSSVFEKKKIPGTLPKALQGDHPIVFNEPEFDSGHPHNANIRAVGVIGANELIKAAKFSLKEKIFAYLHPDRLHAKKHIESLSKLNMKVDVYSPGLSKEERAKFKSENLKFVGRQNYEQIRENYSIIFHQAGQGMCQNMAILGLNQVLLPSYIQNFINARTVEKLGIGEYLNMDTQRDSNYRLFREVIGKMLEKDAQMDIWERTEVFRRRRRLNPQKIIREAIEKYF